MSDEQHPKDIRLTLPVLSTDEAGSVLRALELPGRTLSWVERFDDLVAPLANLRMFICLEEEWRLRGKTWDRREA